MKYLLTGNEGFIGKHLERELSRSDQVIGIDLKKGQDLRLQEYASSLPDCDVILHLAATNGTKLFYEQPKEVLINNTTTTLNLIHRYGSSKSKFVFASTCEIFNGATDLGIYPIPTDERVPIVFIDILNPRWSYSLPKALGENLIANSMENWLIIRYFNIYGPGQKDHFIDEFVRRVKNGEYYIKGDDSRSFCYVEDAVNLTIEASKKCTNQIINIGHNVEYKISDVAKIILELMGVASSKLEIRGGVVGSAKRRCPDVEKVINITNYQYTHNLKNGLIKTMESLL